MLLATFLEEALVVRDTVLAVDEAGCDVSYAPSMQNRTLVLRRVVDPIAGQSALPSESAEEHGEGQLSTHPAIAFVSRRDCSD